MKKQNIKLKLKNLSKESGVYKMLDKAGNVIYIGIDKCVPMIEAETKKAKIEYSTETVAEDIIATILQKASSILNRQYSSYNIHKSPGREFIGVEVDGLRYSALSMSAGEQKVFYILEKVYRAPKFSLILIDELDLLLHDRAMKLLIDVISYQVSALAP